MSRTVRWRARRLLKLVSGYGRGALDIAKERMRSRS
jgi:hypothetical protein